MGMLDFIFRKNSTQKISEKAPQRQVMKAVLVNEPTVSFSALSSVPSENDIAIAAIDAIARNVSKLKGSHCVDHKPVDNRLTRLLQVRPNEVMSASDFLYKVAANYYLTNNAFIFVDRDGTGTPQAFMPVTYVSAQFLKDDSSNLYVSFVLKDGEKRLLPYCDLIHMRRHYASKALIGDDNQTILPALELAQVQNKGLMHSIETSANIRGVLNYNGLLNDNTVIEQKKRFKESFLTAENDGGVIVLDQKTTFHPIEMHPVVLDANQTKEIKNKIFNYYGITESIVTSSYTEDEYAAFYESVIEPFALQMSLEMTAKVFTDREIAFGNSILYEAGRLQFSSNKTKVELIKELLPTGLLTINQCLEILNLPSIDDGDRRIQSLNYIDQAVSTQYQLAKANGKNEDDSKHE